MIFCNISHDASWNVSKKYFRCSKIIISSSNCVSTMQALLGYVLAELEQVLAVEYLKLMNLNSYYLYHPNWKRRIYNYLATPDILIYYFSKGWKKIHYEIM